jgi:hypothetical protein
MINRIAGVSLTRHSKPAGGAPSKAPFAAADLASYIEPVEKVIVNNPAAAVAAAFCLGVALAWWIKRSR